MNKFKAVTKVLTVLIPILLLACILCCAVLFIRGVNTSVFQKEEKEETPPAPELQESIDYGEGYLKCIIFICDKTLVRITDAEASISKDQIWTGPDGTLPLDRALSTASIIRDGITEKSSIPNAISDTKPQYVIITVGLENGVSHCSEEKFKEYYSNLIAKIKNASPDTKIILQSIFPISAQAEKSFPEITNKRIDTANKYIAQLAQENSVRYLNTASALKDQNGKLDPKYDSGDGIILNKEGYIAIAQYMRTHGYK